MKKVNINILIMFIVGILVGFVVSYCTVSFIDGYNYLIENKEKNEDNEYVIYFDDYKENNKIEDDNLVDSTNDYETDNNGGNNVDDVDGDYYANDIDIQINPVSYFENISNSNDENIIKNGFVSIVDFIFYGTEINGYTFEELTTDAKLKIMKSALFIDQKIENLFPGYKETIGNGVKNIYSNVKGFVVELYLDTVYVICENNESVCENAKQDFEFMKKSFGLTGDFIKSLAEAGTDKLKRWYEVFKA